MKNNVKRYQFSKIELLGQALEDDTHRVYKDFDPNDDEQVMKFLEFLNVFLEGSVERYKMDEKYADKTKTIKQVDKLFHDLERLTLRVDELEKQKTENNNAPTERIFSATS